mmetsp:Transcript_20841/g.32151  ORF Transcript_20841/g.32151 Transcript_20841/m.32151 type:complete len:213 (+) Transcript_20841:2744-3382(+)
MDAVLKASAYGPTPSKRPPNTHRRATALKTVNIDLDKSAKKKRDPSQSEEIQKARCATSMAKKTAPFYAPEEFVSHTEVHATENRESLTYSLAEQTITEVPSCDMPNEYASVSKEHPAIEETTDQHLYHTQRLRDSFQNNFISVASGGVPSFNQQQDFPQSQNTTPITKDPYLIKMAGTKVANPFNLKSSTPSQSKSNYRATSKARNKITIP